MAAKKHRTFLFGDFQIAVASRGESPFQHTFGGPHDRKGCSRDDCNGLLLHLLHHFDLTDPAIPIHIPGIRWLPIYYCFDFRANTIGYQLTSDDEMVPFFVANEINVSDEESWPEDNFPLEFPQFTICTDSYEYDPTNLDDAYSWAGIFGIGKLSKKKQVAAKQRAAELAESLGCYPPDTDDEFEEALSLPFMQGKPKYECLNPKCSYHTQPGMLTTIAIMPAEPIEGVHTFGKMGNDVRLIVQKCPKCHTITVSNECG